jgi:hypothetical protein
LAKSVLATSPMFTIQNCSGRLALVNPNFDAAEERHLPALEGAARGVPERLPAPFWPRPVGLAPGARTSAAGLRALYLPTWAVNVVDHHGIGSGRSRIVWSFAQICCFADQAGSRGLRRPRGTLPHLALAAAAATRLTAPTATAAWPPAATTAAAAPAALGGSLGLAGVKQVRYALPFSSLSSIIVRPDLNAAELRTEALTRRRFSNRP